MNWHLVDEDDNTFKLTHVLIEMHLTTEKGQVAGVYHVQLRAQMQLAGREWTCWRELFTEREAETARDRALGAARPFGLEVIDMTKEMEG